MKKKTPAVVALVFVLTTGSALAQQPPLASGSLLLLPVNSMGKIDTTHQTMLTGMVKHVQFNATRSSLQLLVTGPRGQMQEWALEGPRRIVFTRLGKKSQQVQQWDRVNVVLHPLTNNPAAGEIVSVSLANPQ